MHRIADRLAEVEETSPKTLDDTADKLPKDKSTGKNPHGSSPPYAIPKQVRNYHTCQGMIFSFPTGHI